MVSRSLAFVAVLIALSSPAAAQKVDMDAVVKAGEQFYNPAVFALSHRKDLSLTDTQVKALDSLSTGENHFDIMTMARPSADETAMNLMLMNTSVPIDDELVKRGMQARVERETKIAVDRAKADRKVAGVLTPLQRVAFSSLRMRAFADLMATAMPKANH